MLESIQKIALKCLNFVLELFLGVLVIDVLLGVISRYIFGSQVPWTEELAVVLLIWVSFLGIAGAFAARAHLGLDILTEMSSFGVRKNVLCIGHVIVIVFVIIVFLMGGIREVMNSLKFLNILPALRVPDVIRVIPLPLSGIFILLFELCNLKHDLTAKEEEESK